jgi:hypothetical protein
MRTATVYPRPSRAGAGAFSRRWPGGCAGSFKEFVLMHEGHDGIVTRTKKQQSYQWSSNASCLGDWEWELEVGELSRGHQTEAHMKEADKLRLTLDPDGRKAANIKVVGVGGGGSNAVNRMVEVGSAASSSSSPTPTSRRSDYNKAGVKVQIGHKLTKGLGAGADPNIGRPGCARRHRLHHSRAVGRGHDLRDDGPGRRHRHRCARGDCQLWPASSARSRLPS